MRGATRVTWAVASAAAIALAAGACGGGGGESGDGTGVVRASWGEPQNPLEPANTNEVQGGKVLDMIFRGLKEYDPETSEAKDVVAESIETDDNQNFTIRIKEGWKFSDGTDVTADSFVDAWNYGALVTNNQIGSSFFQHIEGYDEVHPADEDAEPSAETMSGLKVEDDHTFTVQLKETFTLWPQTLGYRAFAPLPQAFFDDHDAWLDKPIGNGPYQVDSHSQGQSMKLVRNEEYSGDDEPENDGIELRVYTDVNTAYTDLQAGNIDLIDDVPAAQLENAEQDLDGRFINQPAGIIQTINFPMYEDDWGSDEAESLREGISRAINREEITERIFSGSRTPATDFTSPVLKEAGGYDEGLCGDACEYDPEKAKELIEEGGGLPGGKVTLTSNVDTGSHRQWMDAVCNSINNVLDNDRACTVNPVSTFAEYRRDVSAKRMDGMFRAGWQMDYPLIQNFLEPLYYTDTASNDSGYSNPEFDKLVDEGNAAGDESDAVEKYQEAERLLVEDLPAIPLWYQNGTAGYSDQIDDVALNPFSVPVYHEITVK